MRISIRDQLAALVVFTVLIALTIVSIPTWIFVHNFVTRVEADGLSLTASLKAARITSELNLLTTISGTVATRLLLQQAFADFYGGNATTSDPFAAARSDLQSAMSTSLLTGLLQARLHSRNQTGGGPGGLLNVTGSGINARSQEIILPYLTPNGSTVSLGQPEYGYPPSLYPNVTYQNLGYPNPYVPSTPAVSASAFPGVLLSDNRGLLLGPLIINESFALMSLTIPVRSLTIQNFTLGYMTLISSTSTLIDVQSSREGLGSTGVLLLIGPQGPSNRFTAPLLPSNSTYSPPSNALANQLARFVLPPIPVTRQADRHLSRSYKHGNYGEAFALSQYPGVLEVFSKYNSQLYNNRALLSSRNEQGLPVAVGVARPQTTLVDWAIVVEKTKSEAYDPIATLRKILLGCVFGTAGLVMILILPCAHLSVRPIRRLKIATGNSIKPPGYEQYADNMEEGEEKPTPNSGGTLSSASASIKGLYKAMRRIFKQKRRPMTQAEIDNHRRIFKIPGRVEERKHFITDELTELTSVYNEMTDELVKQYASLDEKVAKRTRELEISKKAAEAANESKTLFIANISHELKTPLNGIMGICAVCMEEDDISNVQHSLKTLYRSGELLLHLLEDLLSFSKNQISQQIRLEDKEFRLGEVRSQILSIFDKQVRESNISFNVTFVNCENNDTVLTNLGLDGMSKRLLALGRLRDVYLWGDQHRILQVIINLVSNGLKFTPPGGLVQVQIRCVCEVEQNAGGEIQSLSSTDYFSATGHSRHRDGEKAGSSSLQSTLSKATTSTPMRTDTSSKLKTFKGSTGIFVTEEVSSPPPPPYPNAKSYMFEFRVEDTGRGIPNDMQQKIFEPFVQVDSSLSKKFGGTGLGLSICSQLAKIMGGDITVESTVGVGSTFCLRIPLKHIKDRVPSTASSSTRSRSRAPSTGSSSHRNSLSSVLAQDPETAKSNCDVATVVSEDNEPRLVGLSTPFFAPNPNQQRTAPPLPSTRTGQNERRAVAYKVKADRTKNATTASGDTTRNNELRVLVADDNSTNIEVVSRMLKLEKVHNVTIAKDGQEAYDLVRTNMEGNQPFDLILMDIQMPNLDGLQSTRLIRKMGYIAPIVALTAFSEESNRRECMESGMDEFLAKPIRRPALKSVLHRFTTILEDERENSGD